MSGKTKRGLLALGILVFSGMFLIDAVDMVRFRFADDFGRAAWYWTQCVTNIGFIAWCFHGLEKTAGTA